MKRLALLILLLPAAAFCQAQTSNKAITEHDPAVRAKDSTIKVTIIDPATQAAAPGDPDWAALTQTISQKYDAVTADRTVTKAKIYFYYGKDWAQFCKAIVHYTDNWELGTDYKVLNLNAGMILQNSSDQDDLKEAAKWSKAAADSDPDNQAYQATYNALKAKVNP